MTKDKKDQTFIITNQSAYFLRPFDSLGAIITAIKFDGRNYDLRENAIMTSLRLKNKLDFIVGSIIKPKRIEGEYSNEVKAWEMVNCMVMS